MTHILIHDTLRHIVVRRSTTQNIPNNTSTIIIFDTIVSQNMLQYNTDTNQITIADAGIYLITLTIAFAINTTGVRRAIINLSGDTLTGANFSASTAADFGRAFATFCGFINPGTTVMAVCFQNSGSALSLQSSPYSPTLSVVRLSQ